MTVNAASVIKTESKTRCDSTANGNAKSGSLTVNAITAPSPCGYSSC